MIGFVKKLQAISCIVIVLTSCNLFENDQESNSKCDEMEYFRVAENMPILEGGLANLQKSVVYPPVAKKKGIEGRVTVQFIVSEDGDVLCPKVIRGIGSGCDEAAIDAVSKAKFTPGMQGGEPVPVQYSLPIVFRIGSND